MNPTWNPPVIRPAFDGTSSLNGKLVSSSVQLCHYRRACERLFSVFSVLLFLFPGFTLPASAQTNISVDANSNRHTINPLVYGVAFATQAQLIDLNSPLNRNGGNATTRYNWQLNATNQALDWYFESLPGNSTRAGGDADDFFSLTRAAGASSMLTIPTMGWLANLGTGRSNLSSYSVKKYGTQMSTDSWMPDAGNGFLTNGNQITGNNPADANVVHDSTFQQSWVQHLVTTWGNATTGGLKYYILDNEPSLWHSTHVDVHPVGATMMEIRNKIIDYGAKIKAVDPNAINVGPEEWGWPGYFYSGYDQQAANLNGWSAFPDRAANGGSDYMPWLLNQLHQDEIATGVRKLDVFSLHYYPEGNEFSDAVDKTTMLLRNKSTRSLWDPKYLDTSWINDYVQLIPRMKSWVATYYPGLKTAITEYNWGAEANINGATTQADIFGIFGQQGLDMATRWTVPDATTPTYKAMKMYRNYDGANSGFGDTSVATTVPNQDNLSSFAAVRSVDGALTVMVINKVLPVKPAVNTSINISIANFSAATSAKVYQLTSTNAINALADATVTGGAISSSVPAQSITLFVIPSSGAAPPPPPPAVPTPTSVSIAPQTVTGGTSVTGTVTISSSAPTGGLVVALASNSAAAAAPASVTIPGGSSQATFAVVTSAVAANSPAKITATANASSASGSLTVLAPVPSQLTLNPASVTGGVSSTSTVTLSGPAPTGGIALSLTSTTAAASVPKSLTIAANSTTGTFTIATSAVSTSSSSTISASGNGAATSGKLTITAASVTPTFTDVTIVSPATFTLGTTATITVTVKDTGGALTGAIPDIEVYNAAGKQMKQWYSTGVSFKNGQSYTYTYTWKPASKGTYTVSVGVFGANWTPDYYWNNSAATITVK